MPYYETNIWPAYCDERGRGWSLWELASVCGRVNTPLCHYIYEPVEFVITYSQIDSALKFGTSA